jgi:hypothetical protein
MKPVKAREIDESDSVKCICVQTSHCVVMCIAAIQPMENATPVLLESITPREMLAYCLLKKQREAGSSVIEETSLGQHGSKCMG